MKKIMLAIMFALSIGFSAVGSTAASFAYQGVLRDEFGQTLDKSTAVINFKLYTAPDGGTALWGRKMTLSIGTNGLFNAELSDASGEATVSSTATLADVIVTAESSSSPLYVGLTVADSSGEIRPRQKLLSVPMAAYAQNVTEATGDFKVGGELQVSGNIGAENGIVTAKGLSISGAEVSSFSTPVNFASGITVGGVDAAQTNLTVNGPMVVKGDICLGKDCRVLLNGKYESTLPIGTITMWSGNPLKLPSGWALCAPRNGKTVKYTDPYDDNLAREVPDLRGRFIVGANWDSDGSRYTKSDSFSEYKMGTATQKGGEEKHKLDINEMPSHNHDINNVGGGKSMRGGSDGYYTDFMREVYKDGWGVNHTTVIANTGNGWAHENRPPYYALCFIIFIGDNEITE